MQKIYNDFLNLYIGELDIIRDDSNRIVLGNYECRYLIEYLREDNSLWVNQKHKDLFFNFFGLIEEHDYQYLVNWVASKYDIPHTAEFTILPF